MVFVPGLATTAVTALLSHFANSPPSQQSPLQGLPRRSQGSAVGRSRAQHGEVERGTNLHTDRPHHGRSRLSSFGHNRDVAGAWSASSAVHPKRLNNRRSGHICGAFLQARNCPGWRAPGNGRSCTNSAYGPDRPHSPTEPAAGACRSATVGGGPAHSAGAEAHEAGRCIPSQGCRQCSGW